MPLDEVQPRGGSLLLALFGETTRMEEMVVNNNDDNDDKRELCDDGFLRFMVSDKTREGEGLQ